MSIGSADEDGFNGRCFGVIELLFLVQCLP